MVGRHCPCKSGAMVGVFETQILGCAIDVVVGDKVDAFKVDGHVYFIAGVGIPAIKPYFVKR